MPNARLPTPAFRCFPSYEQATNLPTFLGARSASGHQTYLPTSAYLCPSGAAKPTYLPQLTCVVHLRLAPTCLPTYLYLGLSFDSFAVIAL
eukprot:6410127-Prymnesium_polylepis.1